MKNKLLPLVSILIECASNSFAQTQNQVPGISIPPIIATSGVVLPTNFNSKNGISEESFRSENPSTQAVYSILPIFPSFISELIGN